jgi:rubrerythrin
MLSLIPLSLDKIKKEDLDKQILRAGIIAELDAINLYEQMSALTTDENIRPILLDVVKEEKTHVGEFQALLLEIDKEQERELNGGGKEVAGLEKKIGMVAVRKGGK